MDNRVSPGHVHLATKRDCLDLKLFLENRLPESCDIYQSLVALITTPGDTTNFYFTRRSDGTFSAIVGLRKESLLDGNKQIQMVWITSTWFEDEDCLNLIYRSFENINWAKDGFISFLQSQNPLPPVKCTLNDLLGDFDVYPINSHFVDIETALNFTLENHGDVYVKSLEPCHAPTVYQYWRYNYTTTVEHVAQQIKRMPSAGVFLKQNDMLVSWIMNHPPNGMSRLYTLDEFRRRGYAALIIKYISKRMAQSGFLPFANIEPGNDASLKLFHSLGFRHLRLAHIVAKDRRN